jgi:molybdopterin molybdotransferase
MISEEEARERVLDAVPRGPVERVGLREADGRWAAEAVWATVALPGFDNSAMDGYAVHGDDCGCTRRWLEVAGEIRAGQDLTGNAGPSISVTPGRVVRVFTGAPVPPGTSAVVMQEDTELDPKGGAIRITEAVARGEFIRSRGADVAAGQKLLKAGDDLTPGRVGLLASQGLTAVAVGGRPRVQVMTTGDEVTPAGQPLPHAASLYNSNGPMLEALTRRLGAEVHSTHAPDALEALTGALAEALGANDMVVLAGGVSVGRHDYVKPALAALGWAPEVWRVAVKPGKPFLFAERGGRCVFGLPGNPVSAFVTHHLFVAPALRRWQGAAAADCLPRVVPAVLAEAVRNDGDRPHFLRGRIHRDGRFQPAGLQESHALFSLSQADALLRVPAGAFWEAGAAVGVQPI